MDFVCWHIKYILFCILSGWGIWIPGDCCGQKLLQSSLPIAPEWLYTGVNGAADASWRYQRAEGEGQSLQEAREACLLDVSSYVKQGWQIRKDTKTEVIFSNQDEHITSVFVFDMQGESLRITVSKKDEYWEWWEYPGGRRIYRCHILYAVAENGGGGEMADLQLTTRYGARGMWRSMLVSGWGQLYKGSKAKGSCILGGEVLLIGGIIIGENLRSDYISKARRTQNVDFRRSYVAKADHWKNARNVCIAGGVALYVYGVIDAIVSPGRTRVADRRFSFAPRLTPGENGCVLVYSF